MPVNDYLPKLGELLRANQFTPEEREIVEHRKNLTKDQTRVEKEITRARKRRLNSLAKVEKKFQEQFSPLYDEQQEIEKEKKTLAENCPRAKTHYVIPGYAHCEVCGYWDRPLAEIGGW